MNTSMDDSRIKSIAELSAFFQSTQRFAMTVETIEDKYRFIDQTVDRFSYRKLHRKDKHIVFLYVKKMTGYKKAQLLRLIKRAVLGKLVRKEYRRTNPNRIYTSVDVKLLEKTDELHLRLNAVATHEIIRREWEIYKHGEYEHLSRVSVSHINNLRHHSVYVNSWVNGTKARPIPIGSTKPPEPNNQPGAIRIDTVSQRDVYHINAVDEITQWEVVVCVPVIAESCMLPALQSLLDQFPFRVFNFHSDRGYEFINYQVAAMLNRLLIKQTKSRSRHCNDNALVETKNGAVIRKTMGYCHINQKDADKVNAFYQNFLNTYLNFHRPCLFLTDTTRDEQGRERRVYGVVKTPYDAFKGIPGAQRFLRDGQSLQNLDTIAMQYSDNEFAALVRKEERTLFQKIYFSQNKRR